MSVRNFTDCGFTHCRFSVSGLPVLCTWDANGNTKTRVTPTGTISYTYDYANRLTQVITGGNTYQYAYDGDGIRTRKTINGTSTDYLWDKALALPVVLTDTNEVYLHGLGLISQQSAARTNHFLSDALGSVRYVLAGWRLRAIYDYDAFGASDVSTSTYFRFAGEQLDAETGLYYLRARYYDPRTGRFHTKDPFGGTIANPASLNRYVYVDNNPVNLIDPSGMEPPTEWADLGSGWSARVDAVTGTDTFEIHVRNPQNVEAGIVRGRLGWINKHGLPAARPAGMPDEVVNALNGVNVNALRQRGLLPAQFRKFTVPLPVMEQMSPTTIPMVWGASGTEHRELVDRRAQRWYPVITMRPTMHRCGRREEGGWDSHAITRKR